jgi:putative spermidine/putrescine transport system permease protein
MPSVTDHRRALARAAAREKLTLLALTVPALLFVGGLLLMPLGRLFWQSIYDHGFTLANYRLLYDDPVYLITFERTFFTSLWVTFLCIVLGFPIAYLAATSRPRLAVLILALVLVPFWTSVLVRTYAWLVLLQRHGLINKGLMSLGLIDEPLALVHNLTGTVIGMVHVMLPFIVLPLYGSLRQIPEDLGKAAASLGAKPGYAFRRVILPLSAPGLLAGGILVFVLCLGFYITPELLGGGRTVMVAMLVQRNVEIYHQFGAASSVAFALLFLVIAVLWITDRFVAVERIFGER